MIRIYVIGLVILVGAILLNGIIAKLGILGWYDFLAGLQTEGKKVFSRMRVVDFMWLFFIYPFLLGGAFYLGDKLYDFLVR